MAEVPLSNGLVALVDDADLPLVQNYKWYAAKRHAGWYAQTNVATGKRRQQGDKQFYMHRLIMDAGPGQQVDHRDGNGLDNRRQNLRLATGSQNLYNAKKPKHGKTSRYKGVHLHTTLQKWAVQITVNGKRQHVGVFEDEYQAARAYDSAAKEHYGEFARLNFKTSWLISCSWCVPFASKLQGSHGICAKCCNRIEAESRRFRNVVGALDALRS